MPQSISVIEHILSANDHLAQENRRLLDGAGFLIERYGVSRRGKNQPDPANH